MGKHNEKADWINFHIGCPLYCNWYIISSHYYFDIKLEGLVLHKTAKYINNPIDYYQGSVQNTSIPLYVMTWLFHSYTCTVYLL